MPITTGPRLHGEYLVPVLWLAAIGFAVLAIAGGVIDYSPVPFWDMWGSVNLVSNASTGGIGVWWAQHNEHRILLSRVLFWIDLSYFRGEQWFLLSVNFLLVAAIVCVFFAILRERLSSGDGVSESRALFPLVAIVLCSWLQSENLTWAFQSQVFLVNLLPLVAFFLLHRAAASPTTSRRSFALASAAGTASLGAMASGIFVLPLMSALALTLRMDRKRTALLAALAVAGVGLYLHGYHSPPAHGSPIETLRRDPLGVLRFVLLYFGGPLFFVTGGSKIAATVAGLCWMCLAAVAAWEWRRETAPATLQAALLAFLAYAGATAFATGAARLVFGVDAALACRYQTPVLMAWATLVALYAPQLGHLLQRQRNRAAFLALLVPALLLPRQLEALQPKDGMLFERWIAALALELGVADQQQISSIAPSAQAGLAAAAGPRETGASIFGNPLLKDARKVIGEVAGGVSAVSCRGNWEAVGAIPGEPRYVRISGWAFAADPRAAPKRVLVLDAKRRIVGYAVTGWPRPDVGAAIDRTAARAGFKGYLLKEYAAESLTFRGSEPDCELTLNPPRVAGAG